MIAKRLFDFISALIGTILLSPIILIIALWIIVDNGMPVFFRQERVGRFGKIFRIYKFRTMVKDAEVIGEKITVGNDSRITKPGLPLRKYKLDEIPQLFNVLKGEMSIVGPRPEVPEYVEYYTDEERQKIQSIRPGITDLASIRFKDENEILENSSNPVKTYVNDILPIKIELYKEYVDDMSFLLDIKIIFNTLLAIVRR